MNSQQVKALLESSIENSVVNAEGEGCNFQVNVVSPVFAGKRSVQRQQMIYAVLHERIASGEIHAVTMTTQTPEEAAGN